MIELISPVVGAFLVHLVKSLVINPSKDLRRRKRRKKMGVID